MKDKTETFVMASSGHDAWFRAKVQEALDDPRPPICGDEVTQYFAARRAAAMERDRLQGL